MTALGAQYKLSRAAHYLMKQNGGDGFTYHDGKWADWKDDGDYQAFRILNRLRREIRNERLSLRRRY